MLETVRATIEAHRMFRPTERVLVAVSGGPDSLALLLSLVALRKELRLKLHVAHVNHGLRPPSGPAEEAFVSRQGKLWGLPVSLLRRKVVPRRGESLEVAARRCRYEALIGLARRLRCRSIAFGHTQDDQAETILMWILRGTGSLGLAGIPPIRPVRSRGNGNRFCPRVVRPLLRCSRAGVEAFLKAHGVRPLRDPSNRSGRFLRNRIRHQLIPLLEREYNPKLRRNLAQLAEILRQEQEWSRMKAQAEQGKLTRRGRGRILLHRERLASAPVALRRWILRLAVERLQGDAQGFDHSHWIALDRQVLNGSGKRLALPHGLRIEPHRAPWLILRTSLK